MKRFIPFLLALALCVSLTPLALAEDSEAVKAADTLYSLGLFKGTGTDETGAPLFDLDRSAGRDEALVMLIRLMGKEQEALSCTAAHPFSDVPQWADRYVAYGYAEGLTNGIGNGLFGSTQTASANMYLTFVLRALGYDDSAADAPYSYSTAADFAAEIGVADKVYEDGSFLRGDIASVSLSALSHTLYNSDVTLIQSLVSSGAVSARSALSAGFQLDSADAQVGDTVTLSMMVPDAGDPYQFIAVDDILEAFPNAYLFGTLLRSPDLIQTQRSASVIQGASLAEYVSLRLLMEDYFDLSGIQPLYDTEYNRVDTYTWGLPEMKPYLAIYDRDLNVIGFSDSFSGEPTVTFTRTDMEIAPLWEQAMEFLSSSLANYDSIHVTVDLDDPQGGWNDGTGMAYHYPVYLDGVPMTGDYCLAVDESYKLTSGIVKGDFKRYLEYTQLSMFFGSVWIIFPDESGQQTVYGELSEQYQNRYTYNKVWNASGDLIQVRYGAYLSEHLSAACFVGVWDKEGNLLGYTILQPDV